MMTEVMYAAELRGKLSRRSERSEDLLTSHVFGFFKYADRSTYLKTLLATWGIQPTPEELLSAEFMFWPTYDDDTEPDLVLVVGQHYILVEAKCFSGFGCADQNRDSQVEREIRGGKDEARSLGKIFHYVVVTADYYYKPERFTEPRTLAGDVFCWTSWQAMGSLILTCLETSGASPADAMMARDLLSLLSRRNLRQFTSFHLLESTTRAVARAGEQVFFDASTAAWRGAFIGFVEGLSDTKGIAPISGECLFFKQR